MKRVLFADLSGKTGLAHDGPDPGRPITSLLRLPRAEGNSAEGFEYGPVFATFRKAFVELIDVVRPDAIGFEAAIGVVGNGGFATGGRTTQHTIRLLYGLVAVTEEIAATLSIPAYESHIATIKKHITGDSRADKQAVMAAVRRLGWDFGDDNNRADAAAGWCLLKSLIDKKFRPVCAPLFARARA